MSTPKESLKMASVRVVVSLMEPDFLYSKSEPSLSSLIDMIGVVVVGSRNT